MRSEQNWSVLLIFSPWHALPFRFNILFDSICHNSAVSNLSALNIYADARGDRVFVRRSTLAGARHSAVFDIPNVLVNGSSMYA